MNRFARINHPCPTTIHSIVGDADGSLAFHKFAVFALVSCLLTPSAASTFRTTCIKERKRNEKHARFVKGYYKKRPREFKHFGQGERELERLLEMVEERFFFAHQSRTVANISATRFNPPNWTGDAAPFIAPDAPYGLVKVPWTFPSNYISTDEVISLVTDYGYDGQAAWSSIVHSTFIPIPDRKRKRVCGGSDAQFDGEYCTDMDDDGTLYQPRPYVAAPARRTRQGGFSHASVLKAISQIRGSEKARTATFEVVYLRRPLEVTAKKHGIKFGTLKSCARRTRGRILKVRKAA